MVLTASQQLTGIEMLLAEESAARDKLTARAVAAERDADFSDVAHALCVSLKATIAESDVRAVQLRAQQQALLAENAAMPTESDDETGGETRAAQRAERQRLRDLVHADLQHIREATDQALAACSPAQPDAAQTPLLLSDTQHDAEPDAAEQEQIATTMVERRHRLEELRRAAARLSEEYAVRFFNAMRDEAGDNITTPAHAEVAHKRLCRDREQLQATVRERDELHDTLTLPHK